MSIVFIVKDCHALIEVLVLVDGSVTSASGNSTALKRDDGIRHQHTIYHVLIAVLTSTIVLLVIFLVVIVLWAFHWRRCRQAKKSDSKISHFTQTNGDVKKRADTHTDIILTQSFINDTNLGITNSAKSTSCNCATAVPVQGSDAHIQAVGAGLIAPALPLTELPSYSCLSTQINEYTPLTRDEQRSTTTGHEPAWRYSSAEDRRLTDDQQIPDVCSTAHNRKSF